MDEAVADIKARTMEGGIAGLNEDSLSAAQASVDAVLSAARQLPMLAPRRFLLVRGVDKWDGERAEKKAKKGDDDAKKARQKTPLELLAEYAETPSPSTVLVLVFDKLDKRKRLYTLSRDRGFLIDCAPPKRAEIPGWVRERVKGRGNSIGRGEAELLAEMLGTDLSALGDAVERLCLYVGEGKPIDEAAIAECVVRLPTGTVWELVGAVGKQDAGRALEVLGDVYDPDDKFKLLGVLGWATRQLVKFDRAKKQGLSDADAAKAAGAPPFKAGELAAQVRQLPEGALGRWLVHLKDADLALKGGSKRPPRAVIERMLLDLSGR